MRPLAAALALAAAACGIPKENYLAKEAEATKYRKLFEQESEKTADVTRKLADLSARIAILEEESRALSERVSASEDNLVAKQTDLRVALERIELLQAIVDQLARSKARLQAAKEELERKSAEYEEMNAALHDEIAAGQVEISELRGRTRVRLRDRVLFASGSAVVDASGRVALRRVAEALRGLRGRVVRVEGHTDDVPVSPGGPFASNWELSSARALAVVRALQEFGVDPTLLVAAAHGQYDPVASNETADGRSQNRRIEIVLAPAEGLAREVEPPVPARRPARPKARAR